MDSNPLDLQAAATSTAVACPLNELPQNVHQYIHDMEQRLQKLESNAAEQRTRLLAMGKAIFANPATKMMMAAFPKDMQNQLRELFSDSNAVTQNSNGNS